MSINYKTAGVDISAGNEAVNRIKQQVEKTFTPAVLTKIGGFGALYDLSQIIKDYRHPVLVQSIDGVGTKVMVAQMLKHYHSIGADIVSATTNDIVVLGAKPLTLLDYIANEKLDPAIVEEIVAGMAAACLENGISLVGGETAEMPGVYATGEHDVVGVVTGVVERDLAITGEKIVTGDVVMAFASSGLHTNGYSLARKLLFDIGGYHIKSHIPGLNAPLGEVLLAAHLNYTRPVLGLLNHGIEIHGMAHITGGGLLENIPRILPVGHDAHIQLGSWPKQIIFEVLTHLGQLPNEEAYRTFNMGVGLVMVLPQQEADRASAWLKENYPQFPLYAIGKIIAGSKQVVLV